MFERKGRMTVPAEGVDADELMLLALDAGAEDVVTDDEEVIEIITSPDALEAVKNAVEDAGFVTETAEITMIPANTIEITDEETATKVLTLLGKLEDYDDIQNVYSNADIPEELIEKLDI
jgi:transcriptional/translational regulatory protein YebC/TACO1